MTLNMYLAHLGWSLADFCRNADIAVNTARRAVREGIVSHRTAQKIAAAFSKAMGERVYPGDIIGLLVQG